MRTNRVNASLCEQKGCKLNKALIKLCVQWLPQQRCVCVCVVKKGDEDDSVEGQKRSIYGAKARNKRTSERG